MQVLTSGTDLARLLPRPHPKKLRSVHIGISDPRTIEATVLGWLPYVDEIVLVKHRRQRRRDRDTGSRA